MYLRSETVLLDCVHVFTITYKQYIGEHICVFLQLSILYIMEFGNHKLCAFDLFLYVTTLSPKKVVTNDGYSHSFYTLPTHYMKKEKKNNNQDIYLSIQH